MKDSYSVLNIFAGRGGCANYSAVNTNDGNENIYTPTTASSQPNDTSHRKSQSLNPSVAVFDRFFQGHFGQSHQRKNWMFMTLVCGLFAVSFGSLLLVLDPYDFLFKMKVRFCEGSETFELWRQPPVQLNLKVYLFNITNKEDFMSGKDSKLKFQEVGPYVYSEHMSHANVTFNENGTMSAIPLHPLTFNPLLSNGTEEDLLIMPNVAMLSIAHVVRDNFFSRMMLNLFMTTSSNPHFIVEMTAKEFMFGYKSTILSMGHKILGSWINFDKLGLIDRMYNFEGDTSTTYTGMTDIRLSGLLENYNGLPYLPQWQGEHCNNITGASDGTKFPSYIKPNDTLYFFRKSLCRKMPLVKVGEEFVGGLPGYRYHFHNNSLDNGVYDSENQCYCRDGSCLVDGLIDVTNCYYGFPIALSYPHFMDGNPSLRNSVEGMNPDPRLHKTYFVINPTSGLPLKLSVKMQINLALGNLDSVGTAKNSGTKFSNLVIPQLWTEIALEGLPQNIITRFYLYLKVAPIAQTISIYLFLVGGVAFILLSLASAICIPKDLKLNQNSSTWREDTLPQDKIIKEKNKQILKDMKKDAKEMEVYYCSFLSPKVTEDELDRLSSFEELEI